MIRSEPTDDTAQETADDQTPAAPGDDTTAIADTSHADDQAAEHTDQPDTDDTDGDDGDPNDAEPAARQAAKYRRKLRNTEAERDQLAGQLEALQRAEAERLAGQHLAKGAALWAGGAELAALLTDTGTVDPDKVRAAAETARDTLGLRSPRPAGYVRGEGRSPRVTGSGNPRDAMVATVMGRDQ